MDTAQPDKKALRAIYGEYPFCFLGSGQAHDFHHILGRGNRFGFKTNAVEREYFSSPFNIAPLGRLPHSSCPILNDENMQRALLSHAYKMVTMAVAAGKYTIQEKDNAFLLLLNVGKLI